MSGKVMVCCAAQVLRAWYEQGHRALVFTQTQQMLDIVEKAVESEGAHCHPPPSSPSAPMCPPPIEYARTVRWLISRHVCVPSVQTSLPKLRNPAA